MTPFDLLALILVAAAAVGCGNHLYVRLPSVLGLLLGSLAITMAVLVINVVTGGTLLPWVHGVLAEVDLSRLFLSGLLGLLLFAATFQVSIDELRENKWVILILTTVSVILSTVLFGFGLYGLCQLVEYPLPLAWCVVIGAVLAPTDAVVVDDLLRRVHIPRALRGAISGESLLNDGAGVVLFVISLQLAGGSTGLIGHGRVALAMLYEGAGGAVLGLAAALLARRVVQRVDHAGLALTVSLALVLVSYRVAAALDLSGPIAVVVAGMAFGRKAPHDGPARDVANFWLLLHEVLNAVVFLLIGLQAAEIPYAQLAWIPVLGAIPLAVATRLLSILPLALLGGELAAQFRRVTVLTWAGMRGGVSIAMVLATPETQWRGELLAICLAVVLFTVVAQGLTLPWLLRRLYGTPAQPAAGQ